MQNKGLDEVAGGHTIKSPKILQGSKGNRKDKGRELLSFLVLIAASTTKRRLPRSPTGQESTKTYQAKWLWGTGSFVLGSAPCQ